MGRSNSTKTIQRQWELLRLIPRREPGLSAAALAERLNRAGHEVSKRTIERDLIDLSLVFPITTTEGTPQGWHWVREREANLPGMELREALALALFRPTLDALAPTPVREALEAKLAQAERLLEGCPTPTGTLIQKLRYVSPALPTLPPTVDDEVRETVEQALATGQQLELDYAAPLDGPPKHLRLHPLGLVQRGACPYLVATAFDYDDPRLYALQRMRTARLLDEAVVVPEGFTLDAYLSQGHLGFGTAAPIHLRARVVPELAIRLQESPLTSAQELVPLGRDYELRAELPHTWQLHWWILSQGPRIEVLEPVALREQVADELDQASRFYT